MEKPRCKNNDKNQNNDEITRTQNPEILNKNSENSLNLPRVSANINSHSSPLELQDPLESSSIKDPRIIVCMIKGKRIKASSDIFRYRILRKSEKVAQKLSTVDAPAMFIFLLISDYVTKH